LHAALESTQGEGFPRGDGIGRPLAEGISWRGPMPSRWKIGGGDCHRASRGRWPVPCRVDRSSHGRTRRGSPAGQQHAIERDQWSRPADTLSGRAANSPAQTTMVSSRSPATGRSPIRLESARSRGGSRRSRRVRKLPPCVFPAANPSVTNRAPASIQPTRGQCPWRASSCHTGSRSRSGSRDRSRAPTGRDPSGDLDRPRWKPSRPAITSVESSARRPRSSPVAKASRSSRSRSDIPFGSETPRARESRGRALLDLDGQVGRTEIAHPHRRAPSPSRKRDIRRDAPARRQHPRRSRSPAPGTPADALGRLPVAM